MEAKLLQVIYYECSSCGAASTQPSEKCWSCDAIFTETIRLINNQKEFENG